MPLRSKIGGILFLSCLSFCHFVLLSETLTLLHIITFEQRVRELWYFTWVSLVILPFCAWLPLFFTLWPWPWSLTHFFENFNFANNFWTVSARALMFLVTRSSYWYQDICTWDLGHLWNWPLSGVIVFYKHILLRFAKRDKRCCTCGQFFMYILGMVCTSLYSTFHI